MRERSGVVMKKRWWRGAAPVVSLLVVKLSSNWVALFITIANLFAAFSCSASAETTAANLSS